MLPFILLIIYANVVLTIFNLVPIPPLDGSKMLYALLPKRYMHVQQFLERYGLVLLLVFILFFFGILHPIIGGLFTFLTGLPPIL